MIIFFIPVGGIANRMRAIDSAVNMFVNKCHLKVYWIKDSGLNCSFNSIFKSVPFIYDSEGRLLNFLFYLHQKFAFIRIIFNTLNKIHFIKIYTEDDSEALSEYKAENTKYCFLIIRSFSSFCTAGQFNSYLFQLQPQIKELVKKETKLFDKNTVGVHIRRTDNRDSIENSPLYSFEERMLKELYDFPATTFYLASDDIKIKDYFEQNPKWKDLILLSQGPLIRSSQEGIIQAIVDLYALSKTRMILGSYWSSFSEIASSIGNITLEVIKKVEN